MIRSPQHLRNVQANVCSPVLLHSLDSICSQDLIVNRIVAILARRPLASNSEHIQYLRVTSRCIRARPCTVRSNKVRHRHSFQLPSSLLVSCLACRTEQVIHTFVLIPRYCKYILSTRCICDCIWATVTPSASSLGLTREEIPCSDRGDIRGERPVVIRQTSQNRDRSDELLHGF